MNNKFHTGIVQFILISYLNFLVGTVAAGRVFSVAPGTADKSANPNHNPNPYNNIHKLTQNL